MSGHKEETGRFYAENASTYASHTSPPNTFWLERFCALLPLGGDVLEIGCGAGRDSAAMLAHGFAVVPTDGVPEMAQEAEQRLGRPVATLAFHEIAYVDAFDGVWANACLLHVPRNGLPDVLKRIRLALRPAGVFYASFKAGTAEGHDALGRYFNYPSQDWLRKVYEAEGWSDVMIESRNGGGYDGVPTMWLDVIARKPAGYMVP